jgi:ketosteroid isomerase-like protein
MSPISLFSTSGPTASSAVVQRPRARTHLAVLAITFLLLALTAACSPQSKTSASEPAEPAMDLTIGPEANASVRAEIEAANGRLMEAVMNTDAAALTALYTSNARLMAPGSETIVGSDAIQTNWQNTFDAGLSTALLETVSAEALGDTAIEEGTFTLRAADGSVMDQGKYIVIWKLDNGSWKLHQDIFNSNLQ